MRQTIGITVMLLIWAAAAYGFYWLGVPVIFALVLGIALAYLIAGVLGRVAERRRNSQ